MKKKLALLLASVMALSTVSVNLFAASDNDLTKNPMTVQEKTIFTEQQDTEDLVVNELGTDEKSDDIKFQADGLYFEIKPKNGVVTNESFDITLTNAKWFFRQDGVAEEKYNGRYGFNNGDSTHDRSKGRLYSPTGPTAATAVAKGLDTSYDRFETATEIPYTLTVYESNDAKAKITINKTWVQDNTNQKYIYIPLVVRTLNEGDVKLTINPGSSSHISPTPKVFAVTSSGATKTHVDDPKEARSEFPINKLVVTESRIGSMESGEFYVIAPSGFKFDGDSATKARVNFEGGLDNATTSGRCLGFKQVDGNDDEQVLLFKVEIDKASQRIAGVMYITGLTVLAEEDTAFDKDIMLQVKNVGGDDVLTNETFKAGRRVDWTVSLTTKGEIPTLVTGRYIATAAANADDDYHLAATVIFKENSTAAWWAERQTVFTLPEKVKVRKLEITESKKLLDNDGIDRNDRMKNPKIGSTTAEAIANVSSFDKDDKATFGTTYTISGLGNTLYPNDNKKHGYVTIDDNKIKFENLKIQKDEKAYMEMKLWLSIAADYADPEIKLTVGGSGINEKENNLPNTVIAKVIQPIKVDTKVTDIKIGYQYYSVADFTITETKPGMLEKNKQVRISISDAISQDMSFTPGFKFETENIKIKNAEVISGAAGSAKGSLGEQGKDNAHLSFIIAANTQDKAGVIKFSNVQVKIDRTVPETSKPYDIIVWGSAVAENYGVYKDQFQVAGVRAPYVRVVTAANDKGQSLTTLVKVKIDDPVITIGDTSTTMDTAAYISPTSESTMVPVRFVSVALGVSEDKVKWDPIERTCTIDAGQANSTRIIQFKIGSDKISINGIVTTMLSPNGTAVQSEVRNDRAFIPMRALGDALGVPVAWDAETRTAVYNPDKEVKVAK